MKTNIAILDIGTNSFHLIVATATPSGNIKIIARNREVIRLSQGNTGGAQIILPQAIERAVEEIKKNKIIANSHNAQLRAIATSAVRESQNKVEFVKIIKELTDVDIEILDGLDEARLIFNGIQKAIPKLHTSSLSIDIGGGSTEFIIGKGNKIENIKSISLGAVRVTKQFFPNYITTDKKIAEAKKWVAKIITPISKDVKTKNIEQFIGTSGTILNVGVMIKAMRGESNIDYLTLNNFEFSANELFELEEKILSANSPAKRKFIQGLEKSRCDIISGGIIILSTIFKIFEIKKMLISNYALREGAIFDMINKI